MLHNRFGTTEDAACLIEGLDYYLALDFVSYGERELYGPNVLALRVSVLMVGAGAAPNAIPLSNLVRASTDLRFDMVGKRIEAFNLSRLVDCLASHRSALVRFFLEPHLSHYCYIAA